jgi:hypothetical protein
VAISFLCVCGQNLHVDEHWAGGSTRCTACGALVRVPSIARELAGIPPVPVLQIKVVEIPMAPASPLQYRRARDLEDDVDSLYRVAEQPNGAKLEAQAKLERKQLRQLLADAKRHVARRRLMAREWQLETEWFHFLLYPLRALLLVIFLGAAWASVIAFLIAVWPSTLALVDVLPRLPLLLIVFLLLGYTWACLEATITAALIGEAGYIAWPNSDRLVRAARGGAQAVACFLAGPVVPALVAFDFWLLSGDLEFVDWLILLELVFLASAYGVLTMLAAQRGRFRDAWPAGVVRMVRCLGYRAVLVAVLIAVGAVGTGSLMLVALEEMHRSFGGWLLMLWCWTAQLLWMLLLLRWLGVKSFKN